MPKYALDIVRRDPLGNRVYVIRQHPLANSATYSAINSTHDQYAAKIEINETTGKVISVQFGTQGKTADNSYTPEDIRRIVNRSSAIINSPLIVVQENTGRFDPTTQGFYYNVNHHC